MFASKLGVNISGAPCDATFNWLRCIRGQNTLAYFVISPMQEKENAYKIDWLLF